MAVLKSVDGKTYEVPDELLEEYELPADVLAQLAGSDAPAPAEKPKDAGAETPSAEDDEAEAGSTAQRGSGD